MEYWLSILDQILIYAIFAVSLNLLLGYAGQVSVAHAAFGAIGGYTAAYLAVYRHVGALPSVLAGAAAAAVVGAVVSLPALRLSQPYLILLTIATSSIVLTTVAALPQLGGSYGLLAEEPANFAPLPGGDLLQPSQWIVPLLLAAALVSAVCRRLGASAWGRVLRGIRDDELAVRALGKNVWSYKVAVFGITAGMAGLAGSLLFHFNQLASPDVYGFNVSLAIFSMVVVGGVGNLAGSVLGAVLIGLVQPVLEQVIRIDPSRGFLIQSVVYGTGLVLVMWLRPQGLLPEGARPVAAVRAWLRRQAGGERTAQPAGERPPALTSPEAAHPAPNGPATVSAVVSPRPRREEVDRAEPEAAVLQVRGLCKRFGGIVAADDLDLDLAGGRITALVGPNGAGKTTVFNLLTGAIRPDRGSVRLRGTEITGRRPDQVARMGMVRSFQDVRVFPRLEAVSNVMLGVQHHAGGWWRWPDRVRGGENLADVFLRPRLTARVERETRERAMRWLEVVGLGGRAGVPAGALAYGEQKLLAIARLLATEADVLLLDEPTSGVDGRWVDTILDLLGGLRAHDKTICVVEHSLHVVEQLADTVCFMELGRITARGPMRELTRDPRLAEVYFGGA